MAETPSVSSPTGSDPDYWCYQCETRVAVETLPDVSDVICNNCKSGFVESMPSRPAVSVSPVTANSDQIDDPTFGNQFIQVLRLIAEAARDNDAPPPPPSDHADPSDDDYLRVDLDGWGNEDEDDDDDVDEEEDNEVEVRNVDEGENLGNRSRSVDDDDDEDDGGNDDDDADEDDEIENRDDLEDLRRRQRRDVLRLRLRDFAARAANRRNRILDWAEILMGLEDHSIELRLQVPDVDYIGNPGDYVDAAGYEALLQTLAESDGSGRRGAPPASKSAIDGLDTLVIKEEQEVMSCAICKDVVNVGEIAKNLPCGHGYHDDCIVQWLGSRNSCPVCRFELPTDDPEYEEERKKRGASITSRASSSSGVAGDDNSPSCL